MRKSKDQLIIQNLLAYKKQNGRFLPLFLVAFVENDIDFIAAFAEKVEAANKLAESRGYPLTATFKEQVGWAVDEWINSSETLTV